MQEIEKLRAEIDRIHVEMASLFRQRLQVTQQVWEIKKAQGFPLFDAAREHAIIHRFDDSIADSEEQQALQNFLKAVLLENKKYLEAKLK